YSVTFTPNEENYAATQDNVALTVEKATLTITDVSAVNRDFEEGNTTVTLTGGDLNGVVEGDKVSFTLGVGTIANAEVGNGKAVTTNIALTGADAGNYTLTQPTDITVNINSTTPILNSRTGGFETRPFYYTLKGEPLGTTKPTVPGVYIEKRPGIAKRIIVR
ncbi:MAG: YDG domain-containing protein, partial [Fibromonadaceae bacterium]|nr:YDG domain-containing protein [Fibromonadaceae bacterium]